MSCYIVNLIKRKRRIMLGECGHPALVFHHIVHMDADGAAPEAAGSSSFLANLGLPHVNGIYR